MPIIRRETAVALCIALLTVALGVYCAYALTATELSWQSLPWLFLGYLYLLWFMRSRVFPAGLSHHIAASRQRLVAGAVWLFVGAFTSAWLSCIPQGLFNDWVWQWLEFSLLLVLVCWGLWQRQPNAKAGAAG
ncbi:hypothetical protein [Idiomarina xiamenensis]|uniref:Transmembrane protein n=1 Tax=Idiomarina xiamenensis 10-D-4 TaxID=740709 RepID=K2KYW5_9GAMM|nr:hypothetical protein [Idiomarina xiamenensis]EKE82920.1 hypothetical protein A10D4_08774 [Idiomarina xiamenensis 10-D-4]